jgi:CRP/FNR family cyclic AMP-dependent transcriptional regulator
VSLFAELPAPVLAAIAEAASLRRYRRGMLLFNAGETADAVFFVLRGTVRVYRDTPDGHEQTLQIMREGDAINVVGFLDEGTYPASAETAADSELAVVRCSEFARLVRARADLAWALLGELGRRLRWAQGRIYDFALRSAAGRVASSLLSLARREGRRLDDGCLLVDVPLTHRELGRLAGLSRETVTRMLPRLREDGAIRWTEEGYVVVDPGKLRRWLTDQAEA